MKTDMYYRIHHPNVWKKERFKQALKTARKIRERRKTLEDLLSGDCVSKALEAIGIAMSNLGAITNQVVEQMAEAARQINVSFGINPTNKEIENQIIYGTPYPKQIHHYNLKPKTIEYYTSYLNPYFKAGCPGGLIWKSQ
jgi:hypothetical protein